MSNSAHVTLAIDARSPINSGLGSGDSHGDDVTEQEVTSWCSRRHHRNLAVCSIICGISCIGIKALINSVQAEREPNKELSKKFSQKAKKFSLISIMTWVAILISIPVLMAFFSYIVTLRD